MDSTIRRNGSILQTIKFKYDDKNRISDYTNTVTGISAKTSFDYSNTSLIDGVSTTQGNLTLSQKYDYDSLGRITGKHIRLNNEGEYWDNITYLQGTKPGTTTNLIDTIQCGDALEKLEYDNLGNITKIYHDGVLKVSYTYDNLNQLKTETKNGVTITYNYDLGGNITSKTTTSSLETSTVNYSYGNTNWKDLLTNYNGQKIIYDAIGNPQEYGSSTKFTWQNGRRLTSLTMGNTNASYTYNVDGIRTQKKVNGVTTDYYLNGSNIVAQISGSNRFDFHYDEKGNVYGFTYNGKIYGYERNAQNDILGIIDNADGGGSLCVIYEYDTWGNAKVNYDDTGIGLGDLNPFKYRGYYYDSESGYYYLQSRYYSPEWGRFINADTTDLLKVSPTTLTNKNLYSYCDNNPIVRVDDEGQCWHLIIGAAVGAVVGLAGQIVSDIVTSTLTREIKISNWQTYVGATVGGAAGGLVLAGTGSINLANTAAGAVTTGVGLSLEKMTIKDYNKSWSEIGMNTVADGAISYGLGKIPGVNTITKGRNSKIAVYKSGLTKLRNATASRMSSNVIIKGVESNIVGGFEMDGYYGIKQYVYDPIKSLLAK